MPAPVYSRSGTPSRYLKISTYGGLLSGGDGNEHLQAYAKNVTLTGGRGDDTYAVYDSSTKITEAAGGGIDTVISYGSYTLSANIENLFMLGAGNDVGTGNAGNNLIIDKDGNDKIITGGGNDVIVSGNGANTFVATKQTGSVTWVQNFKATGTTLDKLDLTGYGLQGFAGVQSKMTQVGSDVRIDLGNSQYVMLEARTLSQITSGSIIVEAAPVGGSTGGTTGGSTGSTGGTTGGTGSTGGTTGGGTTTPVLPSPNAPLSGMKLTFDEEFNSLSLRTGTAATANGIWKTSDGWGNRTLSGNNELQLYVDADYKGLGLNPFSVQDGIATITASKTPDWAKSQIGYNYISGELTTAGSFSQQYGYFEMKAQMAPGQGMWPAFWMLSTNGKWPPEIDIVEAIGDLPNHVYVNTHSATNGNAGKDVWSSADITQGFHTYGVDWTKDTITFYYDGKAAFSRATPADMHTPMYMLLNLAVGGNWPGAPDSTTDWSKTQYKIDYVRVWSHDQNAAVYANVPTGSTGSTSGGTTSGTGSDTQAPSSALAAVLSNATNPLDLADSFTATAGTSATYSGSQMAIAGVSSSASVTVSYDANGGLTVKNNGEWNTVKNATVKSTASGSVTIQNFVDAEVALGDGADTVTVKDAKRGSISTAGGNDTITVNAYNSTAFSSTASDNVMTINAGDGNDVVTFAGASNTSAKIDGGAGDDRINVDTTGKVTVTGGAGADVFAFIAGAHATITDFNASLDRIELKGVSASAVQVTASGTSTLVDLGGGASITLVGVSLPAASVNLSFAA